MIAVPAVDVRLGRCVQLVGGRPEDERVSLPDPTAVARRWWDMGFGTLHVVDLDAALGSGHNRPVIADVLVATDAVVQVGGGVRDDEAADALLSGGADRIVVGTRAVDDPAWLAALAERHPDRVMVAADVRDGRVLRRGWTESSELDVYRFVTDLAPLPLAGVLCTDVAREGRLGGTDLEQARRLVAACPHPVWMSGGIRSLGEIKELDEAGAAGAVLGMALYTGLLDGPRVAEEFGR